MELLKKLNFKGQKEIYRRMPLVLKERKKPDNGAVQLGFC